MLASEKKGMIKKKALAKKLGISRSTLYYRSKMKIKDNVLKKEILEVMEGNKSYGYRRVAPALSKGEKLIRRVMHMNGLKPKLCRRKWPSKKNDIGLPPAHYENLLKGVEIKTPDVAWAADFTYIKYQDYFLYLATVIDVCSKDVVGFAISNRHNRFLVKAAAIDAIKKRGLLPQCFHTDQGSEYQSEEHAVYLYKMGVKISMSKKGSPWENPFQESFYSQFKLELQDTNRFENEGQLIEAIYQQIYYYNNCRIQSSVKMPPSKFYALAVKG